MGCISPYKAQVYAIKEKLGTTYQGGPSDSFSVNVSSVDGFQGSEADVIIISTVKKLVTDAKSRGRFYNVQEDKKLALALAGALVELGQLDTSVTRSLLFPNGKWKVYLLIMSYSKECLLSQAHRSPHISLTPGYNV